MKNNWIISFSAALAFLSSAAFAQVNLTGTVTNGSQPLEGCVVTLADDSNFTRTTEAGAFALSGGTSAINPLALGGSISWVREGKLFFRHDGKSNVSIEVFDIMGNRVKTVLNDNPKADIYGLAPLAGIKAGESMGVYFVTIKTGSYTMTHKMLYKGKYQSAGISSAAAGNDKVLQKASSTPDTLNILCTGYLPIQLELSNLTADVGTLTASKLTKRPNILFSIADDWGYPDASAYGTKMMNTPHFDRVAREGILFHNVWYTAPQCAPSRSTIATGRHLWGNEEAGTHNGWFPENLEDAYADGSSVHAPGQQAPVHLDVFAEFLEDAGYAVGFTRKGINPFEFENGRKTLGEEITHSTSANNDARNEWTGSLDAADYTDCFKDFLDTRNGNQPFFWWYGSKEPHRSYSKYTGEGSGKAEKKLENVVIPPYYPDNDETRHDLLDYALEAEWHDRHLGLMIAKLEEIGELENTIIIATGDNGRPWPRGKASLYDEGTHAPFAIRWGAEIQAGRINHDMLSFVDLAPTFLELAGLPPGPIMTGKSFANILLAKGSGTIDPSRDHVFFGRERHSHSRSYNMGYPSRGVRYKDYLYIRNFKPDRWPMGDPDCGGFQDMDGGITTDLMENYMESGIHPEYTDLSLAKRPEEELYDNVNDPYQMNNLADNPNYQTIKQELWTVLEAELTSTGDPRMVGYGDIWDSYPRMYTNKCDDGTWPGQGNYVPEFWDLAVEQADALGITIKKIQ